MADDTTAELAARGYAVVTVDAGGARRVVDLLDRLAVALDFPHYFGRNLDALNDCLRDVAAGTYGWPDGATGLVLVLRGYDAFARRHPRAARTVLEIVADQSRAAARHGRHLRWLVQPDDPSGTT